MVGKPRAKGPAKVVDLGLFRQRHAYGNAHCIFYVSENERWLDLLRSHGGAQVDSITADAALKAKLIGRDPDLVLVDSGIRWADPIELIDRLHYLLEVPIVMICDARRGRNSAFIKRAYSAGAYDTLIAPLKQDELFETLDVLLKFQRQVSLHQ